MPTIYFVRHGSTEANRKGLTRSWGQFGLDQAGVIAGKHIGKLLKDKGIKEIHSSDLKRAMETAQHVANATGAKIIPAKEMRTRNIGSLSGQKINAVLPQLEFLGKHPEIPAPGGESKKDWFERSSAHLRGIAAKMKDGEAVAVVGHGRHMNGLDGLIASLEGKDVDLKKIPEVGGPGPGSVVKLTIRGDRVQKETLLSGDKSIGVAS